MGAIILATGFQTFDPKRIPYYGYGVYPNVYTALEIERLVNASGPTGGDVTLRDGRTPKTVGIIHCVGSRDENTNRYCSRVCCMYSLKLAHLIKEKTGRGGLQLLHRHADAGQGLRGVLQPGAEGRGPLHPRQGGRCLPGGGQHRAGDPPGRGHPARQGAQDPGRHGGAGHRPRGRRPTPRTVRRMFNITCGGGGFFLERHPKLAPVNTFTDGIFLAGCCQGPKDIPDTVAQAGAAAAEALALIDAGFVEMEPNTAYVVTRSARAARPASRCAPTPPSPSTEDEARPQINEVLCKGCGTCVAACPSGFDPAEPVRGRGDLRGDPGGAGLCLNRPRTCRRAAPTAGSRASSPSSATGAPTWRPTWPAPRA